ncbi:hypothetical protein LTR56_004180 [Elasticomyces elasticus]|nr:hypothetical protein LTR56_004180 [Elasticomyces elasticus]KAK3655070.1 hypothetical protein LTR22_010379 [Elasticomyces elasticus]KAK4910865.1 hypothetical protein LTR49_020476 [Elasticomyces elasticus]KAK5750284.1 hypothetical protein LTS12_019622 [Elasticomyces elasticus]
MDNLIAKTRSPDRAFTFAGVSDADGYTTFALQTKDGCREHDHDHNTGMLVSVARLGTLARLCSASCRLALSVRRPRLVRHFWLTPRIQLKNPESRRPHHKNVLTDSETASTEPLPIAAFLERVKDGSATIDDAQCCLEHHYSILADLPPSTRQEQARSLSVGGQLMTWLWEICHVDRARVCDDQRISDRLCWFLVLEDLEDLVWKWVRMETKQATESPNAEQLMHPGRGPKWTGMLLGGLAQAHLGLAPGGVADNALRRFKQLTDLRSPDSTGFLGSQLVQMRVAIHRALLRTECPPCDAKLFDHFVASTPVVDRPDRVALIRARLRLFHPTKPTARPILHLLKVKHPMVEKVLREARPAGIRSTTSHMMRAACILRLENADNADDDASFLEGLVQLKEPKLWHNREKFWLSLRADPKLKGLFEASEGCGEPSRVPAQWSTPSALLTQVPRTRTVSVGTVRSKSFSQCARPQVIAKRGYAFTIGRYYSKGYHEGDSEDTGVVSIETFVERAAAGLATISDAQSCVMHYYRTFSELPISQRADVVKSLAIGSQVLQWLLTRPGKEILILSKDHGSRDALCWLLVVEGKEDSAWERLNNLARMNRQKLGDDITKDQARDHDWPGALIAGFAAAHLALANNRLADNAIKCFQRLVKLRREGDALLALAQMGVLLWRVQHECIWLAQGCCFFIPRKRQPRHSSDLYGRTSQTWRAFSVHDQRPGTTSLSIYCVRHISYAYTAKKTTRLPSTILSRNGHRLHLWLLVPENLEEFVWKWLHIVANHILSSRDYRVFDRQKPVNQQQEYNEFGWAHHILGALIEAHVQWSADRTANDALRAWERAFHAFGPASRGREWRAIPLVAMSVSITRHLNRDDLAPCDPELYDTWGRTYAQSGLAGPHRLANRRVHHDLYHPTHADAASMLHMVYHSGRPLDDVMFLHSRATSRNTLRVI